MRIEYVPQPGDTDPDRPGAITINGRLVYRTKKFADITVEDLREAHLEQVLGGHTLLATDRDVSDFFPE